MMLDNRTLLVSLVLVSAMMAFSLAVSSWGREHDCLKKWSAAMALESVAWALFMTRGILPYFYAVMLAGVVLVSAQSLKIVAIYQFRNLPVLHWKVAMPVAIALLLLILIPQQDDRQRIFFGSLVFGGQIVLILHTLLGDSDSRAGRAWWLLFCTTAVMLPLFAIRAVISFFGLMQFSTPDSGTAPSPFQLFMFAGMIAMSMLGSMGFILMIMEKADRKIRSLAMIDSLTGNYNRRAFMEMAEKEYAYSQRNGLPLAVLMLDIDYFKKVNDEYGHLAGDAVLVAVAKLLSAGLRKQDTLGRWGGEEFCILLPNTNDEGAMILAEKLRLLIVNTPIHALDKVLSITTSIGVTVCTPGCKTCMQSFPQLLNDADAALYQAKRQGRNQSILQAPVCRQPVLA